MSLPLHVLSLILQYASCNILRGEIVNDRGRFLERIVRRQLNNRAVLDGTMWRTLSDTKDIRVTLYYSWIEDWYIFCVTADGKHRENLYHIIK
jgi:hypothetical protein